MNKVTFSPVGFAYVDVAIKPNDAVSMAYVTYKIDTGANCTTISHTRLSELGYDRDWIIKTGKLLEGEARPTVASGFMVDDCYQILLPQICIGDWVGYNWPFVTSLSVSFKFLLGTDAMQFFNWQFDYENGVCTFDLIKGKRKLMFNKKEQSIHAVDETRQDR